MAKKPKTPPPPPKPGKKHSSASRTVVEIVAIVAAIVAIRLWIFEANVIPSGSMKETLLVGDYILAEKLTFHFREPRPGDIVTFVYPYRAMTPEEAVRFFLRFIIKENPTGPRLLIKRVVGAPGDVLDLKGNVLYRNGKPVREPYIKDGAGDWGPNLTGPYAVPKGHYFMMGDNRYDSADSRYIGPVPRRYITGRAVIIYFSWTPKKCPRHASAAEKTKEGWRCTLGGEILRPGWDFEPASSLRLDRHIRWHRIGKLLKYLR